jgi:hypothetical protein
MVTRGGQSRVRCQKLPTEGGRKGVSLIGCLKSLRQLAIALFVGGVVLSAPAADAMANILTKILREAGEAGGDAAKHGAGALDNAASVLRRLPDSGDAKALAVHVGPEGHWTFSNRKGDTFTAATPEELARAPSALLPPGGSPARLKLYLTPDTVFEQRLKLQELPKNSELYIVSGRDSYPLSRSSSSAGKLYAKIKPDVRLELTDQRFFDEALFRLNRRLNPANVRVLSMQPDGAKRLSRVPAYDPKTRVRAIEAVDPAAIATALAKLRGQTVILTGRVRNGRLEFLPASGDQGSLAMERLTKAAAQADVNLIVLKSSSPSQPGGQTVLWQRVEVAGLDQALTRPTFADFLHAVAEPRQGLSVRASQGSDGRVRLTAIPNNESVVPLGEEIGSWVGDIASQLTGNLVVEGVEAVTRDKRSEREFDMRLFSWLPSTYQFLYLGGLVAGFLGFAVVRQWWQRLWPPERREDYRNNFGFQAARVVRGLVFIVLFLPIAGLPAFLWTWLVFFGSILMLPLRFAVWIARKLGLKTAPKRQSAR